MLITGSANKVKSHRQENTSFWIQVLLIQNCLYRLVTPIHFCLTKIYTIMRDWKACTKSVDALNFTACASDSPLFTVIVSVKVMFLFDQSPVDIDDEITFPGLVRMVVKLIDALSSVCRLALSQSKWLMHAHLTKPDFLVLIRVHVWNCVLVYMYQ